MGETRDIRYFEETIRRLLKERGQWEMKARKLERKLSAIERNIDGKKELGLCDQYSLEQLGELIRPIVHDIRNQISYINMAHSVILRLLESEKDEALREKIVERVNLSIDSIRYVHNRLSSLSYLGGRIPNPNSILSLGELVRTNIEFFQCRHTDLLFECDLEDEETRVPGDSEAMNQIISNLIMNAIEACAPGAGRIIVRIRPSDSEEDKVELVVADNGIGIEDSEKDLLYELNYTTKSTGYGMGLYIVKKAVEYHKGHIYFTSSRQQGTTFTVTLPRYREEDNDPHKDACY